MKKINLKNKLFTDFNSAGGIINLLKKDEIKKANLESQRRDFEISNIEFTPFDMYAEQRLIFEDTSKFSITMATTKMGKTALMIEILIKKMLDAREGNWWWVADFGSQSKMAQKRFVKRLNGFMEQKGKVVRVGEEIPFRQTGNEIHFAGAVVHFRSAQTPEALYGEDVRGVICDEITRWKPESWTAVATTLAATRGWAKLIGNVTTATNFAWKLFKTAQRGKKDWSAHKVTYEAPVRAGVLDIEQVELIREMITEAEFDALFKCVPNADGMNPFGLKRIQQNIVDRLYPGPAVSYGVDLGRKRDFVSIIGINKNGQNCEERNFQKPWDETIDDIIEICGNVTTVVDASGLGDVVMAFLPDNFHGLVYTAKSKQNLMMNIKMAIARKQLGLVRDSILLQELESFQYVFTSNSMKYGAPSGLHDDAVNGLGLALRAYDLYTSGDAELEDWN